MYSWNTKIWSILYYHYFQSAKENLTLTYKIIICSRKISLILWGWGVERQWGKFIDEFSHFLPPPHPHNTMVKIMGMAYNGGTQWGKPINNFSSLSHDSGCGKTLGKTHPLSPPRTPMKQWEKSSWR